MCSSFLVLLLIVYGRGDLVIYEFIIGIRSLRELRIFTCQKLTFAPFHYLFHALSSIVFPLPFLEQLRMRTLRNLCRVSFTLGSNDTPVICNVFEKHKEAYSVPQDQNIHPEYAEKCVPFENAGEIILEYVYGDKELHDYLDQ